MNFQIDRTNTTSTQTKTSYKQTIIDGLANKSIALGNVEHALQNDKQVVQAAITADYKQFECASYELQGDINLAMQVIAKDGNMFNFASEGLRNNKEFVMFSLMHIPKDFVYEHYNNESPAFPIEFISERLRNDKEVMIEAIKRNGVERMESFSNDTSTYNLPLKYASDSLKNDPELVLLAVKENSMSLQFASPEIQKAIGKNDPVKTLESLVNKEVKTTPQKKISVEIGRSR